MKEPAKDPAQEPAKEPAKEPEKPKTKKRAREPSKQGPREQEPKAKKPRNLSYAFYVDTNRAMVGQPMEIGNTEFSVEVQSGTSKLSIAQAGNVYTCTLKNKTLTHVNVKGQTFQVMVQQEKIPKVVHATLVEASSSSEEEEKIVDESEDESDDDDSLPENAAVFMWNGVDFLSTDPKTFKFKDLPDPRRDQPVYFITDYGLPPDIEHACVLIEDTFVWRGMRLIPDMQEALHEWLLLHDRAPKHITVNYNCEANVNEHVRVFLSTFKTLDSIRMHGFMGQNFLRDLKVKHVILSQRESWRHAPNLPASVKALSIAGDFVPGSPQCRETFDLQHLNLTKLTLFPDEPLEPGFMEFMPPNLKELRVNITRWPPSEPDLPILTLTSSFDE